MGRVIVTAQGEKLTSELEMSRRVLVSTRKVWAIQGDPASKITIETERQLSSYTRTGSVPSTTSGGSQLPILPGHQSSLASCRHRHTHTHE